MQNMWISVALIVTVIIVGIIAGKRLSAPGPQRRAVYFAFGTLAVLALWFFIFVAFFPAEWIVPFFTVACIVIPICVYISAPAAQAAPAAQPAAPAANADGLSNEDALLLDFLIGKTLNDDVANADDTFALPKGTEITREIALDAKKHDALLLLTMSVD